MVTTENTYWKLLAIFMFSLGAVIITKKTELGIIIGSVGILLLASGCVKEQFQGIEKLSKHGHATNPQQFFTVHALIGSLLALIGLLLYSGMYGFNAIMNPSLQCSKMFNYSIVGICIFFTILLNVVNFIPRPVGNSTNDDLMNYITQILSGATGVVLFLSAWLIVMRHKID